MSRLNLSGPGDLIAAVPFLLGFYPSDSLVLVTQDADSARLGLVVRADLVPPGAVPELAATLCCPLVSQKVIATFLIIVGGMDHSSASPPHRELVEGMSRALRQDGIDVVHALWTPSATAGAQWRCYDDPDCSGVVADQSSSPVAAAAAAAGAVTFASREEMAALLTPAVDETVLARRADRLRAEAVASLCSAHRLVAHRAQRGFADLQRALRAAHEGHLPVSDDEVVALALALSDHHVRDACLSFCMGEDAPAADRLWLALTRGTPPPFRAEPAVLLAFAAVIRGDGAMADIALCCADAAEPGHRVARLLSWAIQLGLPPKRMRNLAVDAADDARQCLLFDE
ncbi:hypothetical protein GCM10012275_50510 [Longimycelium tulufanense]|uniref:DUF4192 domain-containing protein n=1 Tax=Longimycelium tulufanense TaxID=907463 RepID=A0A8J3FY71_9PSEU|nr:DUF4192 domain-containing protein [Longimycelium tulufanense]GGM73669.1 hypothetical protein GCM10012275_50510 [Longimycelium tulufanense]